MGEVPLCQHMSCVLVTCTPFIDCPPNTPYRHTSIPHKLSRGQRSKRVVEGPGQRRSNARVSYERGTPVVIRARGGYGGGRRNRPRHPHLATPAGAVRGVSYERGTPVITPAGAVCGVSYDRGTPVITPAGAVSRLGRILGGLGESGGGAMARHAPAECSICLQGYLTCICLQGYLGPTGWKMSPRRTLQ
jgi:hypothetical protein